jgi:hypothetical protein
MATAHDQQISVLVGPTCPTCESDDLRWGAPLGALWHGQCRDCGTEYHWYEASSDDDPTCPRCGQPHDEQQTGMPFCEDCEQSDCKFCGATTFRDLLSVNLACRTCEQGEAA